MVFTEQPTDFQKEIDVVSCFIQHHGKFLMLHRLPEKTNGNTWGLPAGKIDAGEEMIAALQRELREETDLVVPQERLAYFSSVCVRNLGHDIGYHMFSLESEERPQIRINPREHQDFAWVTPHESFEMDMIHDQNECTRLFYAL